MDNCSPVVVLEETPQCARTSSITTVSTVQNTDDWTTGSDSNAMSSGLYMSATDKLFPYHLVVDSDFTITKVGKQLPRILEILKEELIGQKIDNVLTITQPRGAQWKWGWLILQNDQSFRAEPSIGMPSLKEIRFKASAVHIAEDSSEAMINIVPDATSMDDLLEMNLTVDDIPLHSGHRDALRMGEKLKNQEMERTEVKKDEIQKVQLALTKERQLLESLVPKHVAEGLRKGENVKPRLHKDVTFFFSDVVGFTDICKQLYPWQVVGLLNRLYCVMDYLADRFNLFKVETIGDAYVCCSGLPEPNPKHAENVANFAYAVSECSKLVLSPVDGEPVHLRIGIHTGSAASGVVGVNNPRYCVFGDTVNVAARHESSGEAGRVHCSAVTRKTLEKTGADKNYTFIERGLVDMKGKGKLKTFWLEPNESNEHINFDGMLQLEMETEDLLLQTKFESELERENTEKTGRLIGQLDSANLEGKQQEIMGPILDIIRRELSNKSLNGSSGSRHNTPARRRSSSSSQSPNIHTGKHFNSVPSGMNRPASGALGGLTNSSVSVQCNADWGSESKGGSDSSMAGRRLLGEKKPSLRRLLGEKKPSLRRLLGEKKPSSRRLRGVRRLSSKDSLSRSGHRRIPSGPVATSPYIQTNKSIRPSSRSPTASPFSMTRKSLSEPPPPPSQSPAMSLYHSRKAPPPPPPGSP